MLCDDGSPGVALGTMRCDAAAEKELGSVCNVNLDKY
jgi:hypothetical protein